MKTKQKQQQQSSTEHTPQHKIPFELQIVYSFSLFHLPRFQQLLNSSHTWIGICLTVFMGNLSIFLSLTTSMSLQLYKSALSLSTSMYAVQRLQFCVLILFNWSFLSVFMSSIFESWERLRCQVEYICISFDYGSNIYAMKCEFHTLYDDKNRYRDEYCIWNTNWLRHKHIITLTQITNIFFVYNLIIQYLALVKKISLQNVSVFITFVCRFIWLLILSLSFSISMFGNEHVRVCVSEFKRIISYRISWKAHPSPISQWFQFKHRD